MVITATELKENLGKYISLSQTEDIFVKKNGHIVIKISGMIKDKKDYLNEFAGLVKDDNISYTVDDIKRMRLNASTYRYKHPFGYLF